MSVVFKSGGFFLLDHGQSLVIPNPPGSSFYPLPGLFYQPKQYFKTKVDTEKFSLKDLFVYLGYPICEEHNDSVASKSAVETKTNETNIFPEHPSKKRKTEVVNFKEKRSWSCAGTVPSFKNSSLAKQCTERRFEHVLPFTVELQKSVSNTSVSASEECTISPHICLKPSGIFNKHIRNSSTKSIVINCDNSSYIIPPKSSFLLSDIFHVDSLVKFAPSSKFNFVVMDPPWSNKSVKRSRHYNMLSSQTCPSDTSNFTKQRSYEDVGYMFHQIDLVNLLHKDGLAAVWVTNNPSHITHVLTVLFPQWELELFTVCFWLKLTNEGVPIVPFNSPHKKPYELLFVAKKRTSSKSLTSEEIDNAISFPFDLLASVQANFSDELSGLSVLKSKTQSPSNGSIDKIIFASIPCIQHSRKPPLEFLYRELTQTKAKVCNNQLDEVYADDDGPHFLELFARSLNSGWVSWGNEVLLFQNSVFFQLNQTEDSV